MLQLENCSSEHVITQKNLYMFYRSSGRLSTDTYSWAICRASLKIGTKTQRQASRQLNTSTNYTSGKPLITQFGQSKSCCVIMLSMFWALAVWCETRPVRPVSSIPAIHLPLKAMLPHIGGFHAFWHAQQRLIAWGVHVGSWEICLWRWQCVRCPSVLFDNASGSFQRLDRPSIVSPGLKTWHGLLRCHGRRPYISQPISPGAQNMPKVQTTSQNDTGDNDIERIGSKTEEKWLFICVVHHDAPVGFLQWMIIALAQGCGGRPHFSTTGGSQKDGNLRDETEATKATKAKKRRERWPTEVLVTLVTSYSYDCSGSPK